MKKTNAFFIALTTSMIYSGCHAQTALKALDGYECRSVKIKGTPEEIWHGTTLPPIYDKPNALSKELGVQPNPAIVKVPIHEQDGFTEILRWNGQPAWIASSVLESYRNADGKRGTCVPSWMSNQRIGFKFN